MTSKILDIIVVSIFLSSTFIYASNVLKADDVSREIIDTELKKSEKVDVLDPVNITETCTDDTDCVYGYCLEEDGKPKHCKCFIGTSGDKCHLIDDCENNELDCGTDTSIKCSYAGGMYGKAYCACPDKNLQFDYDTKTCKDCSCGTYGFGCRTSNGTKECVCGYRTGDKNGYCVECDCLTNSFGCFFDENGKHCICAEGYSSLFGECKECDCGPHQIDCGYHRGGTCRCQPGFAPKYQKCQAICNDTHTCQNGGKCEKQVCNCKDGTSESFCETLDECKSYGDCGDHESVICIYDQNTTKTTCACKNKALAFDNKQKICRECDCGPNGDCSYWYGKKCKCHEGYAEFEGTCKPCKCKGGVCSFSTEGQRLCRCHYGDREVNEECLECDCGRGGFCSYNGTQKICFCYIDYVEYAGKCKYCNCGQHGRCSLNSFGSPVCDCLPGYGEKDGYCEECKCGRGANCTFHYTGKQCSCPEYYEEKNGTCFLIENCNKPNACPVTTKCVDREGGGYECVCAEGFIPIFDKNSGLQDPNKYGCREICLPDDCNAGKCNIIGNTYECICDEGYSGKHCDMKVLNIPGNSALIVVFSISTMILGALLFALSCILWRYLKHAKSAST